MRLSALSTVLFIVLASSCARNLSSAHMRSENVRSSEGALLHFVFFDNPPFYIPENESLSGEGIFNRLLLVGLPERRFVVHLMQENDDVLPWQTKSHCSYSRKLLQSETQQKITPGAVYSVPLFFDLNIAIVVPKKTRDAFFRDFPESLKTSHISLQALLAQKKYKIVKKHGLEGGIPLELAKAIDAYPKIIFAEGFHSTTTPTQMLWEGEGELQLGFQDQVSYYESTSLSGSDNFSFIEIEELKDNRILVAFECLNLTEREKNLFAEFNRNLAEARTKPQYQDIFSKWWRLNKDQRSSLRDLTQGKYDKLLDPTDQ